MVNIIEREGPEVLSLRKGLKCGERGKVWVYMKGLRCG